MTNNIDIKEILFDNDKVQEILKNISTLDLPEAPGVTLTRTEQIFAELENMTNSTKMYPNFKGVSAEMARGVETLLQTKQNVEQMREACNGLKDVSNCESTSNSRGSMEGPSATTLKNKGSTIGK